MSQEVEVAKERHPIRFLFKFVVFVGLLYAAGKFLNDKKNEFSGLTESEARTKFVATVGPKVGDDTAEEIADQVIPKLKDRGILKADPVDAAVDDVKQAADDLADAADEAAEKASDKVSEAVDSVVKD